MENKVAKKPSQAGYRSLKKGMRLQSKPGHESFRCGWYRNSTTIEVSEIPFDRNSP